jgi:hypothetical protein
MCPDCHNQIPLCARCMREAMTARSIWPEPMGMTCGTGFTVKPEPVNISLMPLTGRIITMTTAPGVYTATGMDSFATSA